MVWNYFVETAIATILFWVASVISVHIKPFKNSKILPFWIGSLGTLFIAAFIISYWIDIQRPPMRTMAETRIWYSFLVSLVSLIVYHIYNSKYMLSLGLIMASVFIGVDILHPEYQDKFLMPALQSVWFITHVVVYMLSYAILASASVSVMAGLMVKSDFEANLKQALVLIYPGFALLTLGMFLGAFWAKFAWGNYWAWDPKEIWALITWLFYLAIIHIHRYLPERKTLLSLLLILSFAILLITWLGIKYLPSASQSIHVYGG